MAIFLVIVVQYIRLSSAGMFESIGAIPVIKKWSKKSHTIILLLVSSIMLIKIVLFDMGIIQVILEFFINLLANPLTGMILGLLVAIIEIIKDIGVTVLTFLPLEPLTPLMSLVSTVESLLIKLVVFMLLILQSMQSTRTGGEIVKTRSIDAKTVAKQTVSTGITVFSEEKGMIVDEEVEEQLAPAMIEKRAYIQFWSTTLSIIAIFFIEGFFLLVDGELGTTLRDSFGALLSNILWIIIMVLAVYRLKKKDSKE